MAVTVEEKFESRETTSGQNPSATLTYWIDGTTDDAEARSELGAKAPTQYDLFGTGIFFLPRQDLSVNPIGEQLWEGVVTYGVRPATNESNYSFDTGGGSQHITHSLQTMGQYAPPAKTAPNFRGAIGVTTDDVEGVDILVPVFNFAETNYLPDSVVNGAYKATLLDLTGKVNTAPFKGMAAGECLFLGASGSKRGGGDWEIAFHFAGSPNVTGLVIGDITGIDKKGWEYMWIRYVDRKDGSTGASVKYPAAAYVERVYDYGDFSGLGIGT